MPVANVKLTMCVVFFSCCSTSSSNTVFLLQWAQVISLSYGVGQGTGFIQVFSQTGWPGPMFDWSTLIGAAIWNLFRVGDNSTTLCKRGNLRQCVEPRVLNKHFRSENICRRNSSSASWISGPMSKPLPFSKTPLLVTQKILQQICNSGSLTCRRVQRQRI